ncbi:MAG TPA: ABC transporter substrate-binding protein [Ktedonobacteraceae bacterium]|jgi:ABC-type nitrate/sulfonate/bicarbonate transport system substrate-binding protein|nr:ABC transporter substrate-binding protein [Ktedonobacteraceae bacterium]
MKKNILLISVLLLGLSACAPQASQSQTGLTQISLALDWTPNTNHTGIYVAQQQGLYAQQRLALTLLPYSANTTPEALVSSGKADFGMSFEQNVATARAAGEDVVSIAAIIQHDTSIFIASKNSQIQRPAQFAGKRYATFGGPFESNIIQKMIKCDGGADTNFQSITVNLGILDAVKHGQADFSWGFLGWEGIEAQRQHLDVVTFPPTAYCVPDNYSPVIITSHRLIHQHPDEVRKFMAATSRGYTYAIQHPDAAAQLLMKGVPAGTFDDPGLVIQSQEYLSQQYAKGASKWGIQTLPMWTAFPHFLFETGKEVDANGKPLAKEPDESQFFTNQFLL